MLNTYGMRSFIKEIVDFHANKSLSITMNEIDDLSTFKEVCECLQLGERQLLHEINKKLRKAFKVRELVRLRALRREVFNFK